MTIDLTGEVPQLTSTCHRCRGDRELFHLIETSEWLCRDCFAAVHAEA